MFKFLHKLGLSIGASFVFWSAPVLSQELMTVVVAYSPDSQVYGHQCRRDPNEARRMAMDNCRLRGGNKCRVVATASDGGCVALATGQDAAFGIGEGSKSGEAVGMAHDACGPGCEVQVARCSRKACAEN